jgi:sortase A
VVEVAAVLGLVWIAYTGFNVLRSLNREVSSVLQQPTLTPTPLIMAVVLPSGHTPPDSPGGARPNEAEIPEHLRPLVQSIADLPVPTPGPQQAIRLQIPAIKVDAPVVQGDGWEQLKKGVGQLLNTPDPGEDGNIVLSAHNDVFGEIFRHLDELQPGDEVILFTSQRTYTYVITDSQIVEPTQVEVIEPTSDPKLTLISCYPYMVDKKRIVVSASLKG